jgi:hypothetical protein
VLKKVTRERREKGEDLKIEISTSLPEYLCKGINSFDELSTAGTKSSSARIFGVSEKIYLLLNKSDSHRWRHLLILPF